MASPLLIFLPTFRAAVHLPRSVPLVLILSVCGRFGGLTTTRTLRACDVPSSNSVQSPPRCRYEGAGLSAADIGVGVAVAVAVAVGVSVGVAVAVGVCVIVGVRVAV